MGGIYIRLQRDQKINSGRGARRDLVDNSFLHYQIIGRRPAKPYAFCLGYRELMQRDG